MHDPQGEDADFRRRLADRLTDLRLRIDMGELLTPEAFRAALEPGGHFKADDPRVYKAWVDAGLGPWPG